MTEADTKKESNGSENGEQASQILRQMEHYFGDFNLPRDKFLLEKTKEDDGWVTMETMLKFKRLANLSTDEKVIFEALKSSELIEVNEEDKKVRRCPKIPLPEWTDQRKKDVTKMTVYCKGFPKEGTTLDLLLKHFRAFDNLGNIQMRYYNDLKTKTKQFKGSIFVTFKDRESAEKFMALEEVKYEEKEGAEPLIRKWQEEYFEEKQKEAEKRRKEKDAKKKMKEEERNKEEEKEKEREEKQEKPLPRGTVLHLTGLGDTTMREDIKKMLVSSFQIEEDSIAFVYYEKGQEEAKLRFKEEQQAVKLVEKMKEAEKVSVKENEVTFKVLEGDEEEEFLKKALEDMKSLRNRNKGHKRRGGFGGGGHGKRRRN